MWIFNAIANAVGKNFIGTPNYLFGLLFNRVQADGGVTEAQQCTINELTELQNENLLSSASLVLTPSSYKESKLYSLIPTNGNGDFTFTRATTATRVNADGLVDLVPYNLVQYSEQFENAAWPKVNSSVSANTTTAPNGTTTADSLTPNATLDQHRIDQTPTSNAGAQTFSIYAKANGYGFVGLRIGLTGAAYNLTTGATSNISAGVTASAENIGDGWFRCILTKTSGATNDVCRVNVSDGTATAPNFSGNGTDGIFIWGAQLVEGTQPLDYLQTTDRLDIARIDYSTGEPALLVEPQRTNVVINSVFSGSGLFPTSWNAVLAGGTSTSTASIFTKLGQAWTFTVSNNRQIMAQFYGFTAGSTTSFSVFVEAATDGIQVQAVVGQFQGGTETYFKNGVPCANTEVIEAGNRYTSVMVASASGSQQMRLGIGIRGNVTGSVTLSMPQFEAGAYATSYIPTTTTSVTRNVDVVSKTGISSLIGQTDGTILIDFVLKNPISATNRMVSLTESNWSSGGSIYFNATSSEFNVDIVNAGASVASIAYPFTPQQNTRYKIAVAYKLNDCKMYVNGVDAGSDTSTSAMPTCSELYLNALGGGFNAPYEATAFNSVALFKTRLTNAELAQLTTI